MLSFIVLTLLAYLLGSIPTSIWVSKKVFNIDIRHYGSGNAGATNSFRFLGKKWAIFILVVDVLKGVFAVNLANFHHALDNKPDFLLDFKLFLGLIVIVGHIYPIFANFKGGKGIATMFGVIIAISPLYALIACATFLIVFLLSHYVALGSMLGSVAFVIALSIIPIPLRPQFNLVATSIGFMCTILVIIKHHTNIARLRNGTETKMYFKKRNNEKVNKH